LLLLSLVWRQACIAAAASQLVLRSLIAIGHLRLVAQGSAANAHCAAAEGACASAVLLLIVAPVALLMLVVLLLLLLLLLLLQQPAHIVTAIGDGGVEATSAGRYNSRAIALGHTAVPVELTAGIQAAHSLQHLVDLRLHHAEVFNVLEALQILCQFRLYLQLLAVLVVLQEGPELLESVQLTWWKKT